MGGYCGKVLWDECGGICEARSGSGGFFAVRGKEMSIEFTIRIIKKAGEKSKYAISGHPD